MFGPKSTVSGAFALRVLERGGYAGGMPLAYMWAACPNWHMAGLVNSIEWSKVYHGGIGICGGIGRHQDNETYFRTAALFENVSVFNPTVNVRSDVIAFVHLAQNEPRFDCGDAT